jgi:hypothetical protein
MLDDIILQRIRISISTLSKYVRVNKHKRKQKMNICTGWCLHPVQMPPVTSEVSGAAIRGPLTKGKLSAQNATTPKTPTS